MRKKLGILRVISLVVVGISSVSYLILIPMGATNTILAWRVVSGSLALIAWTFECVAQFLNNERIQPFSLLMIFVWVLNTVLSAIQIH